MKRSLFLLFMLMVGTAAAQKTTVDTTKSANTRKGELSFGVRTTGSFFSANGNYFGLGTGWQIRYRVSETFNTEWFADWIITDIGGLGQRYDAHIGESMMIYPFRKLEEKSRFAPYILGGFCGDYTKVTSNRYFDDGQNRTVQQSKDRWSFATQLGLGTHFRITERFDISLLGQYILHFGADIGSEVRTNSLNREYLYISEDTGGGIEGHVFITLSANFVIADLMKNR